MRALYDERYRNPSNMLASLLKREASGEIVEYGDYKSALMRAVVIAIDAEGGKLETPNGLPEGDRLKQKVISAKGDVLAEYDVNCTCGPRNPMLAIKARIVNALGEVADDDHLRTYWPVFPGQIPVAAGELVYVLYEDNDEDHGLYLSRAPHNLPEEDVNQVLMGLVLRQQESAMTKASFFGGAPPPVNPGVATYNPTTNEQRVQSANRLTRLFVD